MRIFHLLPFGCRGFAVLGGGFRVEASGCRVTLNPWLGVRVKRTSGVEFRVEGYFTLPQPASLSVPLIKPAVEFIGAQKSRFW